MTVPYSPSPQYSLLFPSTSPSVKKLVVFEGSGGGGGGGRGQNLKIDSNVD